MNFQDYFYYDETSPSGLKRLDDFLTPTGGVKLIKGSVVGSVNGDGYWSTTVDGKNYKVHRIILELHGLKTEDLFVDHIDGDRKNNKINNLRLVKPTTNARNQKMKSNNRSGVTGVSFCDNGRGNIYWKARYRCPETNKEISKNFSIEKHGEKGAFDLACCWRRVMIDKLNEQNNAGYTERHGKGD